MSAPGIGVHPDLPTTFVHFTGRPRGVGDNPPVFAGEILDGRVGELASASAWLARAFAEAAGEKVDADFGAEARLVSILIAGKLNGASVFGTSEPVICFSEPSEAARRIMLRDGVVASRGPYAPWGLLFHRAALIERGVRPVLYLSTDELDATDGLPTKLRNRRVRYDPGSADWLHEREWRLCFDAQEQPELLITPDLVAGVIVGRQGWVPPLFTTTQTLAVGPGVTVGRTWSSRSAHGLNRWWWTGEDLVEDGTIDLDFPDFGA
ncbi:hypothetical protein ACFFMR_31370 [Micromonospora andamanensis]|uniref:Uncharacterized protein n=1 Tax=Micromonospora andamanensis TaxID=1287068 RepID=A0ABQ4I609_9ACTN|nr:hypothetical protein [Micromonospora andamanensis]GIJ13221.1 hypothetical protein Van01_64350 [Micromonospora andamanensis]